MGRVLMVAFDLAGVGVERERRVCVEIVARPVVTHPRPRVARSPVGRVRGRIIDSGDPGRPAATLVGLTFPTVPARLVGRGHCVGLPDALSGFCIEGTPRSTDA